MVKVFIGRMSDHEPWWAEWWSALAGIIWCVSALLSGGMAHQPGFAIMLAVAPEWVWYSTSLLLPIGQFWALRRDERAVRWWLCFAMAWWWTLAWMAVSTTGVSVPSLSFYVVFAGINLNSVLRLRPRGN